MWTRRITDLSRTVVRALTGLVLGLGLAGCDGQIEQPQMDANALDANGLLAVYFHDATLTQEALRRVDPSGQLFVGLRQSRLGNPG